MQSKQAIVIGAGVAGMAAAIRLAVQGFEVNVFEANEKPGGKVSMLQRNGYQFDAGPSLFTQPQNLEELFQLCSEPMETYFNYEPVGIACKYFYENGKVINGFTDIKLFSEELADKVGEKPEKVQKYLSGSEKLYRNVGEIFLSHSLHKRRTWLHKRILSALITIRPPFIFSSLNKFNNRKFSSPEAVQLFNRYATYNGSNPFKAPAMLSVIPHLEYNQGVYYPAGGMISITNALYKLAQKKGVKFHFGSPVQRIIHSEGKVWGAVVNNTNVMAPVLISNADVYFTYRNLLGHLPRSKKLLKLERSSSALIFYWGINKSFPELELHNIFFSRNYKEEFDCIFKRGTIFDDPTVYINITSKMEASHAPHGKENWFVMINVPANSGQDWDTLKKKARTFILNKLSRLLQTDIEPLIETEEILDPVTIEQTTGSFKGSLYGTSSNSKLAAFFRPANFTNYISGLYFCGGSVHPGGGIPLCFKSAKIATDLISKRRAYQ